MRITTYLFLPAAIFLSACIGSPTGGGVADMKETLDGASDVSGGTMDTAMADGSDAGPIVDTRMDLSADTGPDVDRPKIPVQLVTDDLMTPTTNMLRRLGFAVTVTDTNADWGTDVVVIDSMPFDSPVSGIEDRVGNRRAHTGGIVVLTGWLTDELGLVRDPDDFRKTVVAIR